MMIIHTHVVHVLFCNFEFSVFLFLPTFPDCQSLSLAPPSFVFGPISVDPFRRSLSLTNILDEREMVRGSIRAWEDPGVTDGNPHMAHR